MNVSTNINSSLVDNNSSIVSGSLLYKNQKKKKFQIWHQTFESKRDDINDMCFGHENRVRKLTAVLNEEERSNGSNRNFLDFSMGSGTEKNKGKSSILPEKVQANINETRRLNEELKKQVEEISKMNALYVIKHGSKYINLKETEVELPNIDENRPQKEKPRNFRYINDNYRSQLMRAFLNFNPIIHLNNLRNLLEKADPAIQADINNLWQTIERDLKEVLDPHYYRKKYQNMSELNAKLRRENKINANTYVDEKTGRISLKIPLIKPNYGFEKKMTRKTAKVNYEFDAIKEFLTHISKIMQDSKIEGYIDKMKTENSIPIEKHINAHFKEIKQAEEILKNLQSNKINKNTENEVKEVKNTVMSQNEEIIKTIQSIRAALIKDIADRKPAEK